MMPCVERMSSVTTEKSKKHITKRMAPVGQCYLPSGSKPAASGRRQLYGNRELTVGCEDLTGGTDKQVKSRVFWGAVTFLFSRTIVAACHPRKNPIKL